MKILNREEFLNPRELKTKAVPTPELGDDCGVLIRELGADGKIACAREFGDAVDLDGPKAVELRALVLRLSLVDEEGGLLCCEDGDLDRILGKNFDLVVRLGDEAMELSGFIGGDETVEDAVKNSESKD